MKSKRPGSKHFLSKDESTCSVDNNDIDELLTSAQISASEHDKDDDFETEFPQESSPSMLPIHGSRSSAPRESIQKRALPKKNSNRPATSTIGTYDSVVESTDLAATANEESKHAIVNDSTEHQQRRVYLEDYAEV